MLYDAGEGGTGAAPSRRGRENQQVEIVRDARRFAAIAWEWDDLATWCGSPLALHDWYMAVLEAHADNIELYVVLVWVGDQLVAAAPLMMEKASRCRRLRLLDSHIGEQDRLLYRDDAALRLLADGIASLRLPLVIYRLPQAYDAKAVLATGLRRRALVICRNRHASAFVPLPRAFGRLELGMSSGRRATIRRKQRAAAKAIGPVSAELLAPHIHELDEPLARLLALEGSGWKGAAGTSLTQDQRMRTFITALARRFAKAERLRMTFLRFGDHDVASRLVLEHGGRWYEIKIGFDERFARYSPGILSMHETLRLACDCGIERYEFLGLYEDWQNHWPHEVRRDQFLATYPFTMDGLRAFFTDGITLARLTFTRGRVLLAERLRHWWGSFGSALER